MTFHPPILPGVVPSPGALLDERRQPDFPEVFAALAARAVTVETAVTRVRLSTLRLGPDSLPRIRSFRVLVAEINALDLGAEARVLVARSDRAPTVRLLTELIESGVLEVRSAPLGGWSPDFTVFSGSRDSTAVLCGFHWFERPYPHRGPALGSLHQGDAARLAARRHAELWEGAHDVGPAIWSLLARADRRSEPSPGPARTRARPVNAQTPAPRTPPVAGRLP